MAVGLRSRQLSGVDAGAFLDERERLSAVRIAGIFLHSLWVSVVVAGGEKRQMRTMLQQCRGAAGESAGPSSPPLDSPVLFLAAWIRIIPRVGPFKRVDDPFDQ